ncbi:MAG TPA: sulfate ABC transporter substrate-binding protein [Gaiellaceae bacterium]|jgi:sulfate/thiosulfate transport system substrate-binding protein|nr:sulfate ABC transporter substrate-binding protein [Gaiellaceae bacterium]
MRRLLPFALILPVVFGCASSAARADRATPAGTTVNLVAYSTPKPVLAKLISRFGHLAAGRGVSFAQSYGPSGSQARAIAAGQPADVAFLSTGLDIDTVADAGIVSRSWTKAPYGGIAADSVVAFVVRPGNPKHIHGWNDLVKPGVQVVTPDPFPSGSAKWNVLAAYGAARKSGLNNRRAVQFVTKLFKNVVSQDSSGSNAANTFFSGKGDVLLTYESEAYAAFAAGKQGKLVVPEPTMLIQLPMVATKNAPAAAKAFIKYAHAPKQQRIFAANGYRPVVKSVLKRPDLASWRKKYDTGPTFNIQDRLFGGWRKADKVWFDLASGRMVKIEQAVGGPTH